MSHKQIYSKVFYDGNPITLRFSCINLTTLRSVSSPMTLHLGPVHFLVKNFTKPVAKESPSTVSNPQHHQPPGDVQPPVLAPARIHLLGLDKIPCLLPHWKITTQVGSRDWFLKLYVQYWPERGNREFVNLCLDRRHFTIYIRHEIQSGNLCLQI